MRDDAVLYTQCPDCGRVTAPAWELRIGADEEGNPPEDGKPAHLLPLLPVLVGCPVCGGEYEITEPAQVAACDATVWHHQTAVPCPTTAHVVRCLVRAGPYAGTGCGELIPGPAGGSRPPPS